MFIKFFGFVYNTNVRFLIYFFYVNLGFYEIYEQKLIHEQILEIVRRIGEETKNNDLTKEETTIVNTSIFRAIERGHVEFVTRICGANPRLVGNTYRENKSIFHFAIECRQEKIYSLIHGLEKDKIHNLVLIRSNDKNSMLHLTGNLSPLSRFNSIQGVALQMQRELQWFKVRISHSLCTYTLFSPHVELTTPHFLITPYNIVLTL